VKTRGAIEIPNGGVRNWYTVLAKTKRRNFLKGGAIGMGKYASMRSRLVVNIPGWIQDLMERLVSILKWDTKRNVFRIERSITGLIPPVFLGTKK
jgi:hypothetical protein